MTIWTRYPTTYLVLCAFFIVGGFANNGFSGIYPAVPFAAFAGILIRKIPISKSMPVLLITVTLSFLVGLNQDSNKLLYPHIGSDVELLPGWGFHQFSDSDIYSLVSPDSVQFTLENEAAQPYYYKKEMEFFNGKRTMTIEKVSVSHPDFATILSPILVDDNGVKYQIFESKLFEQIEKGTINSEALEVVSSLQSEWTRILGNLMYWVILPIFLLQMISSIFSI